ncbi:histidine kinase dimerization/phosphoacceptor domain -containing protein [Methanoplanus endosymbiosus]|uniref:PAS domain S-box protein n=1 Tax=Methanoplanus endosymbiosus TaxID=33865 RepID=A0A9E7PLT0_9EURY|nr:histidine kinase dimerization/phosphoacceptor domain -containing protein [Methanoplanus endosymbiosus]UUX91314.1 PAS domain S-box protein [Methanoplanus endosymbiosus]
MSRQIEESKRELSRVMELLKDEPRGLSITDISRLLNMNRNSVSKYLNMLLISGKVDMRSIGVAKVYFLSHRVPISAMLDYSSDAIVVLDEKQKVVQANDNFISFTGYNRNELIGMRIPDSSLPVITNPTVLKTTNDLLRGEGEAKEIEWEDESGDFFYLVKLIPTVFDEGNPGVTIILEDVTEIRKALREKEMLIDEIHLRVRNNLQVISSLLNMQSQGIEGEQSKEALSEAQRRLSALALVHENLHYSSDQQHINVAEYVKSLAEDISSGLSTDCSGINVEINADMDLGMDLSIPFGMMVNELLTNSFKHAFPDKRGGRIILTLKKVTPSVYTMTFEDDGAGFPVDFDRMNITTLGLSLVKNIAERQLSGSMDIISGNGTKIIINFSEENN